MCKYWDIYSLYEYRYTQPLKSFIPREIKEQEKSLSLTRVSSFKWGIYIGFSMTSYSIEVEQVHKSPLGLEPTLKVLLLDILLYFVEAEFHNIIT